MDVIMRPEIYGRIIIAVVVIIISLIVISLVELIIGSYIISFLLYLGFIWYLLKQVGAIVMYPGSFFFTRADIQIRMSKQIGSRVINFFNAMHALSVCVNQRKYNSFQIQYDFPVMITNHLSYVIGMFEMFEDTLSQRKIQFLNNYRDIRAILQAKEQGKFSINDIIAKPRIVSAIQQVDLPYYNQQFQRLATHIKDIVEILKSFSPPTGTMQLLRFKAYDQNLFQIKYAFYNWKRLFNYQVLVIKVSDKLNLESAIIHSQVKMNQNMVPEKQNISKKAVLFCNPNGVFIQFFGADNEYIRNYVRRGYHVIMWNYRGYGQSTGSPSIKGSQQDALSVYSYYKQLNYDIEIVHGYSIGGAAAVGLVNHLCKNQHNYNNNSETVDILIVDRSFSSIGQMSVQFGKSLHNLTKLIFFRDNIDLSKQFQQVTCQKLLIWDYCDQIIPDRASVKNRIIKRKKTSNKSIQLGDKDQKGQLNEDIETKADFQSIALKLSCSLKLILQRNKTVNSEEKEINSLNEERQTSTQSVSPIQDIETLIKIMRKVDGGGIQLFQNPQQLQRLSINKPEYFYHICESYVLGLVCYGSYFPLKPIIHDHAKIKEETQRKLQNLLLEISQHFHINRQNSQTYSNQEDYAQLPNNIYFIYHRIMQLVNDYFDQRWFSLHGSLLPTNNGHNSSLAEFEMKILNSFIENVLHPEQPKHKELSEDIII